MFSSKFENIIKRNPENVSAFRKIQEYLNKKEALQKTKSLRLDPDVLRRISKVESNAELAYLIHSLLDAHILKRVLVIQSTEGGGIAEFKSIADLPDTVLDIYTDEIVKVSQENLKTFYVVDSL